jgi:hypothetical protein
MSCPALVDSPGRTIDCLRPSIADAKAVPQFGDFESVAELAKAKKDHVKT